MMFSVLLIVLMIFIPAMMPMLLAVALMAPGLVLCHEHERNMGGQMPAHRKDTP